jgi:hypothetical protein
MEATAMTIKCTALFQLSTNIDFPNLPSRRIGGWSETWYFPGTSINAAMTFFQGGTFGFGPNVPGWCSYRAALLPGGAAIVGQRYQQVSPTGATQTVAQLFPGASGFQADIPQQAVLIYTPAAGANNIRRSTLRGIPDSWIVEGELAVPGSVGFPFNPFFQILGNFQIRCRDTSQPTFTILSMTAAGVLTTELPHTIVAGQMVRILRTKTVDGDLLGGRFMVSSTGPGNNVLTLFNWTPAEATVGGRIRVDAIAYNFVNVGGCQVGRAVTRRVGRPFTSYRGRRARRTT